MKRWLSSFIASAIVLVAMPAAAAAHWGGDHGNDKQDIARYILPPGNYGGLPFTTNSTDQLPLYSGLTPLRDNVSRDDINRLFLPEDFQPIGPTHEEATGRPGLRADLRLLRDPPHLRSDPRRRRLRRRLGDRARPQPAAAARPRARPASRWPTSPTSTPSAWSPAGRSFVPSADTEAPGHRAAEAARPDLRRQGSADPRRRPGLRRRHQRLLERRQQHQPAPGDRQRRASRSPPSSARSSAPAAAARPPTPTCSRSCSNRSARPRATRPGTT